MYDDAEQAEIKALLKQNQELLIENNKILNKLRRQAVWAFWFRLSSYLIIIGLPFALYYYVIAPYLQIIGTDYQALMQMISGLSGLENLNQYLKPPQQ